MRDARLILYFISGALPRLSMLVVLFALARLLPLAETGLFVLVVTVGEVLEMTVGNWLRIYLLKREAGRPVLTPSRTGRMLILSIGATVLAALLAVPVVYAVAPERFGDFLFAVLAYVGSYALLRYALTLLQLGGDHGKFAGVEIGRSILMVPCVLGAAFYAPGSFLVPSLCLSLATFIVAAGGLIDARARFSRPAFSATGVRPALSFGAPIVADTILSLLIVYFDRFVLNQMLGPGAVAIYALSYALARQPIEFIAGPLNNFALPQLFAAYASEGEAGARRVQTGLSVTMFILCAGMFVGILLLRQPLVILLLKPENCAEAEPILPIIALSACLLCIKAFLYDNIFHMLHRNAEKLASVLAVTLASMGLTILLVWSFQLYGAALALLASSAVSLGASVIISRRYFVFDIPFRQIAGIALAVVVAGVALQGAAMLAEPFGTIAVIVAGFAAFSAVYAVALSLLGVSLAALVSTPWAPLRLRG